MADKAGKGQFWADEAATEILRHTERHAILRDLVARRGLLVYDEKTPSGTIHVGSSRGWVMHDVMARALRARGAPARFVLSADDMDPYDKPSAGLPRAEWDRFLGMPFRRIPSPEPAFESWADFYFRQCTDLFPRWGIDCALESTGALYEQGAFDAAIERALDLAPLIQGIYAELYGDTPASHRLPFNPVCESCGRIATTRALEWDPVRAQVRYECRSDVMGYTDPATGRAEQIPGCGHDGWRSPFGGGGKFPWKVEWAAKWATRGVVAEWAGKDHFSEGGSRTAACRFSLEVFEYPPPYPSDGRRTGGGYEFLVVGGRKMSTSKGAGASFAEIGDALSPEMLRFLMVRSRPNQVIDFDPNRDADIVNLYNEFDRVERVAYGRSASDPEALVARMRSVYAFSRPGVRVEPGQEPPYRVPFKIAALVGQSVDDPRDAVATLRKIGQLPDGAGDEEAIERVRQARAWLECYAPDSNLRIDLNQAVPPGLEIGPEQRRVLAAIAADLRAHTGGQATLSEPEMKSRIFAHIREEGLEQGSFFEIAYRVLLGRPNGPHLSPFLLSMASRVLPLLEEAGGLSGQT